ncbi:hypothetical protein FA13DRAFT_161945 [Coprinellus micaceus]|uniref:Uncharacterized protein n=1 Tax=Coprinellus micaceus TaxID=71717 RepID=A0A4Y7TI06_COPMI|nr:hypothetical protein FA13DRAFT_161945 [Coprinellus micaceus]
MPKLRVSVVHESVRAWVWTTPKGLRKSASECTRRVVECRCSCLCRCPASEPPSGEDTMKAHPGTRPPSGCWRRTRPRHASRDYHAYKDAPATAYNPRKRRSSALARHPNTFVSTAARSSGNANEGLSNPARFLPFYQLRSSASLSVKSSDASWTSMT